MSVLVPSQPVTAPSVPWIGSARERNHRYAERVGLLPWLARLDAAPERRVDAGEVIGMVIVAPGGDGAGRGAGVVVPALVAPGALAVGIGHPRELGNGVREGAEAGLPGPELLLRAPARLGRAGHLERVPDPGRESLRQVVRDAGLHQLDGEVLVAAAREHHDGRIGPRIADPRQQRERVLARDVVVEQHAVVLGLAQALERFGGRPRLVRAGVDPRLVNGAPHREAVELIVVDDEQPHGSSTSDQYLLSATITSQKFWNVTGLSR
jgi:hypothetical protein